MSKFSRILAIFSLMTVGAVSAHADINDPQTGKRFYLGPVVGANFPTGNFGSNVSPVFGLMAGAKVVPMFGVGFYGTYNGQYSTGSFLGLSTGSQVSHFVLMGEGDLYVSVFRVGVAAGAEINSWSAGAGGVSVGTSNSGFIFGPTVGVDIPLASIVSLGADVRYLLTTLQSSQGNIVASANVKFWF